MNPLTPHQHNGTDSPKLYASDALENAPQASVSNTGSSAGATYTTAEQSIINSHTATLTDLINKLKTLGLIK